MQIGRKMTDFEAFEVLSVILEHPVLHRPAASTNPWAMKQQLYRVFQNY